MAIINLTLEEYQELLDKNEELDERLNRIEEHLGINLEDIDDDYDEELDQIEGSNISESKGESSTTLL